MRVCLVSLVFLVFFTSSEAADLGLKIKDIKTVDDVQEARNIIINRLNEKLNSDELTDEMSLLLKNRILLISSKPLPTQEQIDWRIENPLDIKRIRKNKEKIKKNLKMKLIHYFKNIQKTS